MSKIVVIKRSLFEERKNILDKNKNKREVEKRRDIALRSFIIISPFFC
jgi:hypothetical protein